MGSYGKNREDTNAANRRASQSERDIAADYPGAGDLARRNACALDLRLFCSTYFPEAFSLAWSPDHLRVLDRLRAAVLDGGLFALAMPRGSGKTTMSERAAIWALLYGHRRFVAIVSSTEAAAEGILDHIKTELQYNELLAVDHRQVCYPIRRLENNGRRCIGQLFDGQQTNIDWSAKRLVLPTMPGSACDGPNVSASCVTVVGLTGALRGQSHVLPGGKIIRPELVLLDDPQTRESAMSPAQSAERVAIVQGDVLGLAGPGKRIAAVMPCTVIRENDLADQLLNRATAPQWQGERTKAVYAWPTDEKLWEDYHRIRSDCLRRDGKTREATDFYRANREAMDAGAKVAWDARHNPDELSAIQHAMNLRADLGDFAFSAEYQNEPLKADDGAAPPLKADEVAARCNGLRRGVAAPRAEHITAFIDVHDKLLFWAVCGWSADYTGWVLDYGAWPDQKRSVFTLAKCSRSLAQASPGAGREGAIAAGLDALGEHLIGREWQREDGVMLRIGRMLIDSGYVPDVVHDYCRRSPHSAVVMPSRGVGVGAAGRPMSEYTRHRGDRLGWYWYIPAPAPGSRSTRVLRFDSNFYKSFIHARLAAPVGDKAALSLWGKDQHNHKLIADHVTAEVPTRVSANGRAIDEWRVRPGVSDNHWLDCLVGCAVAASFVGATMPGAEAKPVERKRIRLSDLQRANAQ